MLGIWCNGEYSDHYMGIVDLGDDADTPRREAFFRRATSDCYESFAAQVVGVGPDPMDWAEFLVHYDVRKCHAAECPVQKDYPPDSVMSAARRAGTMPEMMAEFNAGRAAACRCWREPLDATPDGTQRAYEVDGPAEPRRAEVTGCDDCPLCGDMRTNEGMGVAMGCVFCGPLGELGPDA